MSGIGLACLFASLCAATSAAWSLARLLGFRRANATGEWLLACGALFMVTIVGGVGLLGLLGELLHAPFVTPLNWTALLVAIAGAAWLAQWRLAPPTTRDPSDTLRWRGPNWSQTQLTLLLLPILTLHAGLILVAALTPPDTYDGILYHLPNIVRWLQSARISMDPAVYDTAVSSNGDLWLMLFAATRIEPLIELAMLPVGLLMATAAFGIARLLGAGARGGTLAVVLVLSVPMLALQLYSSYVDAFGIAFLGIAIYGALRAVLRWQLPATRWLILIGLCLGLALGTKQTFLVWTAPIVGLLVIVALFQSTAPSTLHRATRTAHVLAILALATLPGVWLWWPRAALETGWFLYPYKIALGPLVFGAGVSMQTGYIKVPLTGWRALLYPWIEAKNAGYSYSVGSGTGPALAAFSALALAFLVAARANPSLRRVRNWFLAYIAFGIVAFILLLNAHPRYAAPLWFMCAVACAPLLTWLWRRAEWSAVPLTLAAVSLSCAMIGLWPAKNLLGRLRDNALNRAAVYELPANFESLPPGSTILNLGRETQNYALTGSHHQYHVLDSQHAHAFQLNQQITPNRLRHHPFDYVLTRGDATPPLAPGLRATLILDNTNDPRRHKSTTPARIWQIHPQPPSLAERNEPRPNNLPPSVGD